MILIGLGILFALALAVMMLWNWLIPEIFHGGPVISFWQALGLMFLARILFGGFKPPYAASGSGDHKTYWKDKIKAKWDCMDPDKKERIKEKFFGGPHTEEEPEEE